MGVPKWRPPPSEPPSSPPRKRPRLQAPSGLLNIVRRQDSQNFRYLHGLPSFGSRRPTHSRPAPIAGPSRATGPPPPLPQDAELGSERDNQYERELEARYTPLSPSLHPASPPPPPSDRSLAVAEQENEHGLHGPTYPQFRAGHSQTDWLRPPYHTTLRRHNAIRNLRRMLQPTSQNEVMPYHNQAWTSSFHLPQVAQSQASLSSAQESSNEAQSRSRELEETVGASSAHPEFSQRLGVAPTDDSFPSTRSANQPPLRLMSMAESSRMAWLVGKSHSTGLVPNAARKDHDAEQPEKANEIEECKDSENQDAVAENSDDEEDSVRPITRSTSFSSSRSRRSVHFTNPVSDSHEGAESDSSSEIAIGDDDRSSFTPRAGTPPAGVRWNMVPAIAPDLSSEYLGYAEEMPELRELLDPFEVDLDGEEDLDADLGNSLDADMAGNSGTDE